MKSLWSCQHKIIDLQNFVMILEILARNLNYDSSLHDMLLRGRDSIGLSQLMSPDLNLSVGHI